MKKFILTILLVLSAFVFVGCGNEEKEDPQNKPQEQEEKKEENNNNENKEVPNLVVEEKLNAYFEELAYLIANDDNEGLEKLAENISNDITSYEGLYNSFSEYVLDVYGNEETYKKMVIEFFNTFVEGFKETLDPATKVQFELLYASLVDMYKNLSVEKFEEFVNQLMGLAMSYEKNLLNAEVKEYIVEYKQEVIEALDEAFNKIEEIVTDEQVILTIQYIYNESKSTLNGITDLDSLIDVLVSLKASLYAYDQTLTDEDVNHFIDFIKETLKERMEVFFSNGNVYFMGIKINETGLEVVDFLFDIEEFGDDEVEELVYILIDNLIDENEEALCEVGYNIKDSFKEVKEHFETNIKDELSEDIAAVIETRLELVDKSLDKFNLTKLKKLCALLALSIFSNQENVLYE